MVIADGLRVSGMHRRELAGEQANAGHPSAFGARPVRSGTGDRPEDHGHSLGGRPVTLLHSAAYSRSKVPSLLLPFAQFKFISFYTNFLVF